MGRQETYFTCISDNDNYIYHMKKFEDINLQQNIIISGIYLSKLSIKTSKLKP